jgi:Leucine-rich repeat (LRR) protein
MALIVILLSAALVLGANLCERSHYSVDDKGCISVYGMPFPYEVTARSNRYPVLGDLERAPLRPFHLGAAIGDAAVGLLLLSGLSFFFFRRGWPPPLSRRSRCLVWLIATAILVPLAAWGFVVEKAAYERQREILAQIQQAGGHIDIDYSPVPDVVWSAMRKIGRWWASEEQADNFLNASMATIVFLQGPPPILAYVKELPSLRSLDIFDDRNLPEPYVPIRLSPETAPRLERIDVELGYVHLRDIIELPRLRFLIVIGTPEAESCRALTRLKGLEVLAMPIGLPDGDEHVIEFGSLTNLRVLELCGPVTNAMLHSIGTLPRLEELDLDGLFNDDGIMALQNLRSLKRLRLSSDDISDNATNALKRLTELRCLNVAGSSITDTGLANLASLPHLEELTLDFTRITNAGLPVLAELPHLKKLELYGTDVDNSGIEAVIGNLNSLESLRLGRTKVTDQGVADLRKLKTLRELDLTDTKVTDRCIDDLLDMKSLSGIGLNATPVTPKAVARLKELPNLQRLGIKMCPSITHADLRQLQDLMPQVDIIEFVHYPL